MSGVRGGDFWRETVIIDRACDVGTPSLPKTEPDFMGSAVFSLISAQNRPLNFRGDLSASLTAPYLKSASPWVVPWVWFKGFAKKTDQQIP